MSQKMVTQKDLELNSSIDTPDLQLYMNNLLSGGGTKPKPDKPPSSYWANKRETTWKQVGKTES